MCLRNIRIGCCVSLGEDSHNRKGEVISSTSPLGEAINYTYNPIGNLISKTDEDGLTTTYDYNISGKLAKIAYADGKTVELSYNSLKQLTEMKDHLGITSIEYDVLGRVTKTIDHDNNEINYAYNALNQREKLTYPDGSEVNYAYNASGRLTSVAHIPVGAEIPQVTSYIHDPKGQITQRILPDTTTTTCEYNPLGVLSSLTHSKDGDILDQFKYAYDPLGNITQIEKQRKGVDIDSGVFNYTYDPLNRLTEETRTYNNTHGNAQDVSQFMYDNLGNRITSIKGDVQTNYAYNARNQLVRTTEGIDAANGINNSDAHSATTPTVNDYHYDNRGNLTQITENGLLKQAFTFDATGMMTQAFTQGKGMAEYTYNGFKKRVGRVESLNNLATATPTLHMPAASIQDLTSDVKYVLDMTRPYNNLLATKGTNQPTQSFIWGGSLLSVNKNNESSHYLNDHLGSPIRLIDGDNNTPIAYGVFGESLLEDPSSLSSNAATPQQPQPFGFTSYQTDDVSGMYYAQARYYDPARARFVSEDLLKGHISSPVTLNPYTYCINSPLGFVDLDGNSPNVYVVDDNLGGCSNRSYRPNDDTNKQGSSGNNYGAAIFLTDSGGRNVHGDNHVTNPFGHTALAIQTLYGDWWIVDFREVGGSSNKATVIFAPLENIVFGPNGHSIVSADFTHALMTNYDTGFNINRYDHQIFFYGDFSASWDAAFASSANSPNFNFIGLNCVWLTIQILQYSTVGTSAHNQLEQTLWYHRFIPSGFFRWDYVRTGLRHTIIPNNVRYRIEQMMRDAGFTTILSTNVQDQHYSNILMSILMAGVLSGNMKLGIDSTQTCE